MTAKQIDPGLNVLNLLEELAFFQTQNVTIALVQAFLCGVSGAGKTTSLYRSVLYDFKEAA